MKFPVPLQIIPAPENLYAVFADTDGNAFFERVVALGNLEVDPDPEQPIRVVAGYTVGDHLNPADFRHNFLGYFTGVPDTIPTELWNKVAAKKAKEIRAAKLKAAESKIIVPKVGVEHPHLKQ
jgi:hypothetical protein